MLKFGGKIHGSGLDMRGLSLLALEIESHEADLVEG